MGSGTTLMRLIVDSHENIAVAQETSIIRAYLAHRWIPFHRHGGDWYGRLGWSEDELDERMRDFYSGMFERFAAEQGKTRWGDKTPWHAWHLREISRLFPDAVVIAMVRHPGAVATSVSGRFRQTWAGAVTHWVNTTTEIVQRAAELGDRLLLVRYEDLVQDPETTLREVFAWLDEPWSDRLLEHEKVHAERGTARKVEGSARSDEPIAADRVSAWTEGRDPHELQVLGRKAKALAPFYGYAVDDADALAPMTVPGSPRVKTLTGTEVTVRRGQFPGLDGAFKRKVTTWPGNQMLKPSAFGLIKAEPRRADKAAPDAAQEAAVTGAADRGGRPGQTSRRRIVDSVRARITRSP
jgi:hypothetical protein